MLQFFVKSIYYIFNPYLLLYFREEFESAKEFLEITRSPSFIEKSAAVFTRVGLKVMIWQNIVREASSSTGA